MKTVEQITTAEIDYWTEIEQERAKEILPKLVCKLIYASCENIKNFWVVSKKFTKQTATPIWIFTSMQIVLERVICTPILAEESDLTGMVTFQGVWLQFHPLGYKANITAKNTALFTECLRI